MSKKFFFSFAILFVVWTILFVSPTQAREDQFTPVSGEVKADSVGMEKAVVTAEGGLNLYSAQGKLLAGFPILVDNQVFASSPILANVIGDDESEIVAVTRTGNNYSLSAFDGNGATLGTIALGTGELYFEPVAISQPGGGFSDIVVAGINGKVMKYRFNNNTFAETLVIDTQIATGLATNLENDLLILNFPEQNGIRIYNWSNDNLILQKNLAIAQRFIYPIRDGGKGVWYGVNRAGELIGFNSSTGSLVPGFPAANAVLPSGSPIVVSYDENNQGDEIIVPLSNGKTNIFTEQGTVLPGIKQKQSFVEPGLPAQDETSGGIFFGVKNYGLKVIASLKDSLISIFTRISGVIIQGNPEIDVKVSGNSIASGGNYDLGTYDLGEQISFKVRIDNLGNGTLNLTGALPVELTGEAGNRCQIPSQPAVNISSRGFKEVIINCRYDIAGEQTIGISIANNDANENPYFVSLKTTISNNKVQDGTMEAVGMDKWAKYGPTINFEKSTVVFNNGARSMRVSLPGSTIGFQQRNIPVEAGKIYRFSFNYRLTNGQLKVLLGINSSNGDFQNRLAILSDVGQWNSFIREFKVPANFAGDFRLVYMVVNGEAFVDDIKIYEIPQFTLVLDGDMEYSGTDRWIKYGVPTVFEKSTAVFKNGKRSFRIGAPIAGGFQQQFVAVEPGKNYRLTFNYQITNGKLNVRLGNRNSNSDFENRSAVFTKKGSWESYIREFKVPDAANFLGDWRIVFNAEKNTDSSAEAYVDDVVIQEIPAASVIVDGNMEANGVGAWADWGNYVVLKEKDSVEKHTGSYGLKIRSGSLDGAEVGGVQQTGINNLTQRKTYIFSFWYKNNLGVFIPRLGIHSSNLDFELPRGQRPIFYAPSNGWQYYERTFTLPADFAGDFRVVFAMYDMAWALDHQTYTDLDYAELYLDEVAIKEIVQ